MAIIDLFSCFLSYINTVVSFAKLLFWYANFLSPTKYSCNTSSPQLHNIGVVPENYAKNWQHNICFYPTSYFLVFTNVKAVFSLPFLGRYLPCLFIGPYRCWSERCPPLVTCSYLRLGKTTYKYGSELYNLPSDMRWCRFYPWQS